jgi:hypothetical protein
MTQCDPLQALYKVVRQHGLRPLQATEADLDRYPMGFYVDGRVNIIFAASIVDNEPRFLQPPPDIYVKLSRLNGMSITNRLGLSLDAIQKFFP